MVEMIERLRIQKEVSIQALHAFQDREVIDALGGEPALVHHEAGTGVAVAISIAIAVAVAVSVAVAVAVAVSVAVAVAVAVSFPFALSFLISMARSAVDCGASTGHDQTHGTDQNELA